jgi:hypothetical protein
VLASDTHGAVVAADHAQSRVAVTDSDPEPPESVKVIGVLAICT